MKLIAPDYYKDFKCIADRCKHSCCIGWEIDIDADTYDYYCGISGEMGERLKQNISLEGDTASFILDKSERCPFLNEKGLCDIITAFGEDSLCQICADHPRFRNFLSDRTEIGLGLCCEAAARLILGKNEKVKLVTLSQDNSIEEFDFEEEQILSLREQIFAILQDRDMCFDERFFKMLSICDIELPNASNKQIAEQYSKLERLDKEWDTYLNLLSQSEEITHIDNRWDICFEQLAVYLVYRHFTEAIYDFRIKGRIGFVADALRFMQRLCGVLCEKSMLNFDVFCDMARFFSSEIEYSEENIEFLISKYEFD